MQTPQDPSATAGSESPSPAKASTWWTVPQLWLLGILSLAYAPMFWGQIIFFRDPAHWNFPARALVRKALLNGEFPHWNPFTGLGLPVWGNPLYGVFYPPNWLLLLVPETLLANALTWQSFLHMFWGGWGLIVLSRQFGCTRAPALVAGLAWSMGGYTTSMWSAGLLLIAGAWMPWVAAGLIAGLKAAHEGRWAVAMIKAGVPLAFAWLTGEPFIAMMSAGFALLTTFAWHVNQGGRLVELKPGRWSLSLIAGWACALLVAAIVVIPARAVLSQSPRAKGVGALEAERYSLHPLRVIEFVAPESFGLPVVDYPGGKYVGEEAIDGLPLAFSVYFGAGAFALALMALGQRRRVATFLAACWVLVLLLTFGRHLPVHSIWRSVALPFGYMRYPEKYIVLMAGWAALLAGLGSHRILQGELPWRRAALLLIGMLMGLVLCGYVFEFPVARYMRGGIVRGALILVVLLALMWLRQKRPKFFAPALCVLIWVDFAPTIWNLQPFGPGHMVLGKPPMAQAIIANARPGEIPRLYRSQKVSDAVAKFVTADSMAASESRWLQTLTPNFGSFFDIATLPGYDAATSTHFESFWVEGKQFGSTLLRLLAIDFALLPVTAPSEVDHRAADQYEFVSDVLPGARLYKVQGALPRVYVAGAAAVLSDEKTLELLFTPQVADGGMALIANGQGVTPLRADPRRVGNCELKPKSWSQIEALCNVEDSGVVVFVEQYDPAWTVWVNGKKEKLLRVNYALRGVRVSPGQHHVVMKYIPRDVDKAAWLSLLGVAGFAFAGVTAATRTRGLHEDRLAKR